MSFEQVEQAWNLADEALKFKEQTGEPSLQDYWDRFFAAQAQVDAERSLREGGTPPGRIFLKSPYGLQFRPDFKDWIPFRHGEVTLD